MLQELAPDEEEDDSGSDADEQAAELAEQQVGLCGADTPSLLTTSRMNLVLVASFGNKSNHIRMHRQRMSALCVFTCTGSWEGRAGR